MYIQSYLVATLHIPYHVQYNQRPAFPWIIFAFSQKKKYFHLIIICLTQPQRTDRCKRDFFYFYRKFVGVYAGKNPEQDLTWYFHYLIVIRHNRRWPTITVPVLLRTKFLNISIVSLLSFSSWNNSFNQKDLTWLLDCSAQLQRPNCNKHQLCIPIFQIKISHDYLITWPTTTEHVIDTWRQTIITGAAEAQLWQTPLCIPIVSLLMSSYGNNFSNKDLTRLFSLPDKIADDQQVQNMSLIRVTNAESKTWAIILRHPMSREPIRTGWKLVMETILKRNWWC